MALAEAEILAGNLDVEGLCLSLADWSAELRLLQNEKGRQASAQRREGKGTSGNQALTE